VSAPVEIRLEGAEWVTDWGVIKHGCPQPNRGDVDQLMLATPTWVRHLLSCKSKVMVRGCWQWVTTDGRRIWAHIEDLDGRTWVWELFPAYFDDGKGPQILIGRWPD